jgi:predicted secreted hydrolase
MRAWVLILAVSALVACGREAAETKGSAQGAHLASISAPESRLEALRSDTDAAGFMLAQKPIEFEFPRDHGPHPDFRHEWWYVTGNLDADNGDRFGFQLTFFRFAVAPPAEDKPPENSSAWRTRQIYMAHFAITDVERREFRFAERLSRQALDLAGARAEPLRVWLEDWYMSSSPDSPSWTLHANAEGYELTLEIQPLTQPVLNGERGLSLKSAEGAASYYYSFPRMAAKGQVRRADQTHAVSGLAWLDREWGSGALASDQSGWDWFALQFENGSALMYYQLRKRDGTRDPYSAGTWVEPDGRARALTSTDVAIDILDHWNSPRGGRYPSRWRVRDPSLALDITVRPLLADQELQTDPRYWEGAVQIQGTRAGKQTSGRGYVELVGYADAGEQ